MDKMVETRSYPLPDKFIGKELAIIETPGKFGKRDAGILRARIVGTITFLGSFEYTSRAQWLKDRHRHRVSPDDQSFQWKDNQPKHGWIIQSVIKFEKPMPPPEKRGIIFATKCQVSDFLGSDIKIKPHP